VSHHRKICIFYGLFFLSKKTYDPIFPIPSYGCLKKAVVSFTILMFLVSPMGYAIRPELNVYPFKQPPGFLYCPATMHTLRCIPSFLLPRCETDHTNPGDQCDSPPSKSRDEFPSPITSIFHTDRRSPLTNSRIFYWLSQYIPPQNRFTNTLPSPFLPELPVP